MFLVKCISSKKVNKFFSLYILYLSHIFFACKDTAILERKKEFYVFFHFNFPFNFSKQLSECAGAFLWLY